MIRYGIKNNIKLMGRSPINIFLYIVMPLILIAVLSSSFDDLMKKYEENETLKAGYRIEDSGTQKELIDALKDIAKDNDIELTEYETGEIGDIVKNEELSGFVVFDLESADQVNPGLAEKIKKRGLELLTLGQLEEMLG